MKTEKPFRRSEAEMRERLEVWRRLVARLEGYATFTAKMRLLVRRRAAYEDLEEMHVAGVNDETVGRVLAVYLVELLALSSFIRDTEPELAAIAGKQLHLYVNAWVEEDVAAARGSVAPIQMLPPPSRVGMLAPTHDIREAAGLPRRSGPRGSRSLPFELPATVEEFRSRILGPACDALEREGHELSELGLAIHWKVVTGDKGRVGDRETGVRRVREVLDAFGVDWVAYRKTRARR